MYKILLFSLVSLIFVSCKSTEKFTGYSYDPPNVTNTLDKEINPQYRRIIGAGEPTIWVSNKFEGARANDFYALNDSTFEVFIEPENAPINNSPWFAFKIWSDVPQSAYIRLNYNHARHRYVPKITIADSIYSIDMRTAVYDSTRTSLTFPIEVSAKPITVSAQIITDTEYYENWIAEIAEPEYVSVHNFATSKEGNPIKEMVISEVPAGEEAGVLVIISRQHPPEVSGFFAAQFFLEELASSTELASSFRKEFEIRAYPLINIDGVLNGHWRHNSAGIDLNRDWEFFNQPETRAVKDALLPLKDDPLRTVYYGIDFHSTNENLFYPIDQAVKTTPDDLTQRWVPFIMADNPEIKFTIEEFPTDSPISKNWIYKTFGADALTYEVSDELNMEQIEEITRSAARSLMRLLLLEKSK